MSYQVVRFINKDYNIPSDLLTYIDLLELTDDVRMAVNKRFYERLEASDVGCIGDEELQPEIDKQVGRLVANLLDHGIYDRTVNDYLSSNKGIELISKVNKEALSKMKELLIQEMDEYQSGLEDALYKRDASITGMGFSIWSSSFVNHAIYAAMEASTLSKQEAAANQEYQKDLDALEASVSNKHTGAKKKYIKEIYIPSMEMAVAVFAYELLDAYVSDLIKSGKLNKEILEYINIDRSDNLLSNLNLSERKEEILYKAFEACPYNLRVYIEALNCGFMDYETYKAAKYVGQGKNVLLALVRNLGEVEYPNVFRINYEIAEMIAAFTGESVSSILHEKTKKYAMDVVDRYAYVGAILRRKEVAEKELSKLSDKMILSGDVVSKNKAASCVNSIVPKHIWNELTGICGFNDLLCGAKAELKAEVKGIEKTKTKEELDAILEERLYGIFEEVRLDRVEKIYKQRQEDARKREAEVENARITAERNRKIKKICVIAAIVLVVAAIGSTIINKVNNAKAYQEMAGEFCVYQVIDNDGNERDDFNWWLSISEDGTMEMSSWSYVTGDYKTNSYSGALSNKANYKKIEEYRIEDYGANASEYEKATSCYEFHIADEWDEFEGYVICWQYQNGKTVDVYCNDYRYSFVEIGENYSFDKWEAEIDSDGLSENVEKLVNNVVNTSDVESKLDGDSIATQVDYDEDITSSTSLESNSNDSTLDENLNADIDKMKEYASYIGGAATEVFRDYPDFEDDGDTYYQSEDNLFEIEGYYKFEYFEDHISSVRFAWIPTDWRGDEEYVVSCLTECFGDYIKRVELLDDEWICYFWENVTGDNLSISYYIAEDEGEIQVRVN